QKAHLVQARRRHLSCDQDASDANPDAEQERFVKEVGLRRELSCSLELRAESAVYVTPWPVPTLRRSHPICSTSRPSARWTSKRRIWRWCSRFLAVRAAGSSSTHSLRPRCRRVAGILRP